MHTLIRRCGFLASLSLFVACATTTPGLGDDAGNTALPRGVTLLDSDKASCDGTVQVGEETIEGKGNGLRSEFFVERGENATFELEEEYDEIEWACVDDGSPDVDTMRCPRGTTHVRLTRAATGGELLFECYGDSRRY